MSNFKMDRRSFLRSAAAFGLLSGIPGLSAAQQSEIIKLMVGFPVGGPADSITRLLAAHMGAPGSTVIVENRPGASGQIAADHVKRASTNDGVSLLVTPSSTLSLVPHLYKRPMYDSLNDFVPVGYVCDHSFGLAVAADSPIKTVEQFIDEAKKRGKDATYASAGNGTGMHLLGSIFTRETGVPLTHVAYRGTAPGLQDLIGGHVFSTFNPLPTMLELSRSGRLRILAVTNPERVSNLPDVPTFNEAGLPALELVEWYGVFASAKLSAKTQSYIQTLLDNALQKKEFADSARKLELEPRRAPAQTLAGMLQADYEKWAVLVKETGISLDA